MEETEETAFHLGAPALVCRWRMVGRRVPLLNRHMRALAARKIDGRLVGRALVSWAKQHIEWSLADDTKVAVPDDGVLMLVIDGDGRAAMTVGPYEPLTKATVDALAARAVAARREACTTGVAPEVLCAVADGTLLVGAAPDEAGCGALTLVEQLAETRGLAVRRVLADVSPSDAGAAWTPQALVGLLPGAVMLVSDEHGVCAAEEALRQGDAGASGARVFCDDYQALLASASR